MTKREELVALADRLAPLQYATGISFTYNEFQMVLSSLRAQASAAPPEREADRTTLNSIPEDGFNCIFLYENGREVGCLNGPQNDPDVIARAEHWCRLSSRDDGEAKSSEDEPSNGKQPTMEPRLSPPGSSEANHEWPPLKKALWRAVISENMNDGHYIPAFKFVEKLFKVASEAPSTIPADVLAMKEACKRAADDLSNEYFAKSRELMHKEGEGRAKAASDACDEVSAAISRIDVPAKADAGEIDVPGKTAGESDLRSANIARQKEWDAGNQITLAYRGNELAGEVGEACNVIKKLERERLDIAGSRDTVAHLAEELADVVICADLIAMQAGIDLDAAVVAKFNASSEKVGLKTRIRSALMTEGK